MKVSGPQFDITPHSSAKMYKSSYLLHSHRNQLSSRWWKRSTVLLSKSSSQSSWTQRLGWSSEPGNPIKGIQLCRWTVLFSIVKEKTWSVKYKTIVFLFRKVKALIMIFLPHWGFCGEAPDSGALPCRQRMYPAHLSRWGKEECHTVHTGYRINDLQLSSEQHYHNLKSLSRQVHVKYLYSSLKPFNH